MGLGGEMGCANGPVDQHDFSVCSDWHRYSVGYRVGSFEYADNSRVGWGSRSVL